MMEEQIRKLAAECYAADSISDIEDVLKKCVSLQSMEPDKQEWRCYHCAEVFTDQRLAWEHFGDESTCASDVPGCIDPLRMDEKERIRELREAREFAQKCMADMHMWNDRLSVLEQEQTSLRQYFGEDCTTVWLAGDRHKSAMNRLGDVEKQLATLQSREPGQLMQPIVWPDMKFSFSGCLSPVEKAHNNAVLACREAVKVALAEPLASGGVEAPPHCHAGTRTAKGDIHGNRRIQEFSRIASTSGNQQSGQQTHGSAEVSAVSEERRDAEGSGDGGIRNGEGVQILQVRDGRESPVAEPVPAPGPRPVCPKCSAKEVYFYKCTSLNSGSWRVWVQCSGTDDHRFECNSPTDFSRFFPSVPEGMAERIARSVVREGGVMMLRAARPHTGERILLNLSEKELTEIVSRVLRGEG